MLAIHLAMTQAQTGEKKKVTTSLVLRNTTMWVKTDTHIVTQANLSQVKRTTQANERPEFHCLQSKEQDKQSKHRQVRLLRSDVSKK